MGPRPWSASVHRPRARISVAAVHGTPKNSPHGVTIPSSEELQRAYGAVVVGEGRCAAPLNPLAVQRRPGVYVQQEEEASKVRDPQCECETLEHSFPSSLSATALAALA